MATPPPALRTIRTIARLPASWRQATHVRTGSRGGFATGLPVGIARLDVDAVTGELGGEPGVLTIAPDRQRELGARHQDSCGPGRAVDSHRLGFGRSE